MESYVGKVKKFRVKISNARPEGQANFQLLFQQYFNSYFNNPGKNKTIPKYPDRIKILELETLKDRRL
jgi:hypothetical protein